MRTKLVISLVLAVVVFGLTTSQKSRLPPPGYVSLDLDDVPRTSSPGPAIVRNLPRSFDSRTRWPECPGIGVISNQRNCGSCWAVSSADVLSNRLCIASQGRIQKHISSVDILQCCGYGQCTQNISGGGCDGGSPHGVMRYYTEHGIVTGAGYPNKTGCKPYPDNPKADPSINQPTLKCLSTCQAAYPIPYEQDHHYGVAYGQLPQEEAKIQSEIFKHGPVAAGVCGDDIQYDERELKLCPVKPGVARCNLTHAVRIIGWGEKDATPYWLAANSWGDWEELHGFFKVVRSSTDGPDSPCGLQSSVSWALAKPN